MPSPQSSGIVRCPCQHCQKLIGFEVSELAEENSVVECPHCNLKTKLFIPPPASPPRPLATTKEEAAAPAPKLVVRMSGIVRCPCQHCKKLIGFEAGELAEENSVVECPHCSLKTKLFVPPPSSPPKPMATTKEVAATPPKVAAGVSGVVRCPCQHCQKLIGFEAGELAEENSVVECPHCSLKTKLFIPPPVSPPKPTVVAAAVADGSEIVYKQDTLKLLDDRLTIRKRGDASTERVIFLADLTTVQTKPANTITLGCIQLMYAGSKTFMGGAREATQESVAFLFGKESNDAVAAFKAKVEKLMSEAKLAAAKTPAAADGEK